MYYQTFISTIYKIPSSMVPLLGNWMVTLLLVYCPLMLLSDAINPNRIGVKFSFRVWGVGEAKYTMSLFWPTYWSKVFPILNWNFRFLSWQLLKPCYYCANTGIFNEILRCMVYYKKNTVWTRNARVGSCESIIFHIQLCWYMLTIIFEIDVSNALRDQITDFTYLK